MDPTALSTDAQTDYSEDRLQWEAAEKVGSFKDLKVYLN